MGEIPGEHKNGAGGNRPHVERRAASVLAHSSETLAPADVVKQRPVVLARRAMDRPARLAHVAAIPREIVLLYGSLRVDNLSAQLGRSLLDIPMAPGKTLLDHWIEQASGLAEAVGGNGVRLTIVVGKNVAAPQSIRCRGGLEVVICSDPRPVRGTGGVLADVLASRQDDESVLVGYGSHFLRWPLVSLCEELAAAHSDVAVLADERRQSSGLFLIRCGCLKNLPPTGFIDLKEQALSRIAQDGKVTVVTSRQVPPIVIRSLHDYLRAVHSPAAAMIVGHHSAPMPAMIEPGAVVARDSRLFNSVVLCGGVVEPQAVVVESVVTSSMRVRSGELLVRQTLRSPGKLSHWMNKS